MHKHSKVQITVLLVPIINNATLISKELIKVFENVRKKKVLFIKEGSSFEQFP